MGATRSAGDAVHGARCGYLQSRRVFNGVKFHRRGAGEGLGEVLRKNRIVLLLECGDDDILTLRSRFSTFYFFYPSIDGTCRSKRPCIRRAFDCNFFAYIKKSSLYIDV